MMFHSTQTLKPFVPRSRGNIITECWEVLGGHHQIHLHRPVAAHDPRYRPSLPPRNHSAIVILWTCPHQPIHGPDKRTPAHWTVSLHVYGVPAWPRGEEETRVSANDVASHEVEAVQGHDEAGPAVRAGRLEGDFDGKVPNYRAVAFVVPIEGAAAAVVTQRRAPPSDLGQAHGHSVHDLPIGSVRERVPAVQVIVEGCGRGYRGLYLTRDHYEERRRLCRRRRRVVLIVRSS